MRTILFNGPPRSGKDTAANTVEKMLCRLPSNPFVLSDKFSAPNKQAFAGMMDLEISSDFIVPYYEDHKEEIIPSLGISYRQWQIDFSEKFMKPLYGEQIFAKLLWDRNTAKSENSVGALTPDYLVLSDCGFQIEVDYLISKLNHKDILIFRLHREGFDFSKDSRSYITAPRTVLQLDIYNTNLLSLKTDIIDVVRIWLNGLPEE